MFIPMSLRSNDDEVECFPRQPMAKVQVPEKVLI